MVNFAQKFFTAHFPFSEWIYVGPKSAFRKIFGWWIDSAKWGLFAAIVPNAPSTKPALPENYT